MTTVSFRPLTPIRALFAWIDPNQAIVSQDVLVAPDETATQEHQRSLSQMDTSKIDAATVALRELGLAPDARDDGGLIESVAATCPAAAVPAPGLATTCSRSFRPRMRTC